MAVIPRGRTRALVGVTAVLWWAAACGGGLRPITPAPPPARDTTAGVPGALPGDAGPEVRVAITTQPGAVELTAGAAWQLETAGRRSAVLVRAQGGDGWRVERSGRRLRAVGRAGKSSAWADGPLVARAVDGEPVALGARRYRGELLLVPTDSGILVVNRLPLEEYLRGVVPLEIGPDRRRDELAAVEAQAVAARSYAMVRLRERASARDTGRDYDLGAGTLDQVYGGVGAEQPLSDDAVRATAGLVLLYAGEVATTPYHASCGGTTAASSEVWSSAPVPYLQSVSDRVPGTDRNYCDIAPRATWTRTLERDELQRALDRYLPAYVSVPAGGVGDIREVRVDGTTPSGRVARLELVTDRGVFGLRANQIRFVLRDAAGGILNSTYFTVSRAPVRRGESAPVATLHGRGNGHGVGMCQWGAIGRARAGQDFRTILSAYYPGTSVGHAG